jgi:DNA-binding MarR family transcriptional regulator
MKARQPLNRPSDALELEKLQIQDNNPMGLAYMAGRLHRALRSQLRVVLKPLGLTLGQYTALSVFHHCGRLSNAQLAERTMVSPQAANELLKGMEKNGWILRKPDPNHGRIINISLTKKGVQLMRCCDKLVAKLERKMLKGLSYKQIVTLHDQLQTAVSTLKEI